MITFNITYQITQLNISRYLRSPLKHPKVSFQSDNIISHWETIHIPQPKDFFSLKISKANIIHLQARKLISICLLKTAFQEYFGGRNQIQSCSSPFLTKNPFIQLNWVQSQRILIIHNSISDFLHLLLKNTYLTFLRSSSFCFFFLR